MVNSDPEGTYDPRSSSVTPSRRSFLSKTAAAGGAVLVGSKILPESSGASIKDQPSTGAKINFENEWNEPITTEYATPVARYQYKKGPNSVTSTAPINMIAVNTSSEEVLSPLIDRGWVTQPKEYIRFAVDRETGQYIRPTSTAAETYYGTSGRLHVRCWELEGIVSIQAHEDTGARPKHRVASYNRGHVTLEKIYAATGWTVLPDIINLANSQADHDGTATVLKTDYTK